MYSAGANASPTKQLQFDSSAASADPQSSALQLQSPSHASLPQSLQSVPQSVPASNPSPSRPGTSLGPARPFTPMPNSLSALSAVNPHAAALYLSAFPIARPLTASASTGSLLSSTQSLQPQSSTDALLSASASTASLPTAVSLSPITPAQQQQQQQGGLSNSISLASLYSNSSVMPGTRPGTAISPAKLAEYDQIRFGVCRRALSLTDCVFDIRSSKLHTQHVEVPTESLVHALEPLDNPLPTDERKQLFPNIGDR